MVRIILAVYASALIWAWVVSSSISHVELALFTPLHVLLTTATKGF